MSFTVYPAIDLRAGRVVRLKEGDPARMTAYSDEPAETAKRWLTMGAKWLHVVNLDGAFGEGDGANQNALVSIESSERSPPPNCTSALNSFATFKMDRSAC